MNRKRTAGPARPRTAAEWEHSERCLVDDDLRDLYVGGQPRTGWEAHRASVLVLVVLVCVLVAWLVWGGQPDAGRPAAIGRAQLATAGAAGMSTRRKLNLCACGTPKEKVASTCRTCYLSNARKPVRTRKQAAEEAARELWDYWPIWEHYRGRAAA